ncbi:Mitochondrial translocator assembly and maintenance protein 41 [Maudiozyma exigua]|uniref:Phosphatidate cytidylyltransferase, mitochondrial n=1 Tax=Maudiozyma exigua TaxID=34358 RepID=A0A9P6W1X7_MAUEX|nr:Mitochondrial translocator assembly and maintenance protein 41 [Kazachstania exigua]
MIRSKLSHANSLRVMYRRTYMSTNQLRSNVSETVSPDKKSDETILHIKTDIQPSSVSQHNELSMLEKEMKRISDLSNNITDHTSIITELPPNFGLNQFISIDHEIETDLQHIVQSFNTPIEVAIGYGSGVFEQAGYNTTATEKPQIDMILGVTSAEEFHRNNLIQNPDHYSMMKYFGSSALSKFQDIGAGLYFNPFTEILGHQVKYGIVSMDKLLKDLSQWDSFYLAGRLQKPVKFLKHNMSVMYWNQINLRNAATLAKHLTLKKSGLKSIDIISIDEFQFFKEITGLSYLGDIRYKLGGENPNKINNIVTKNLDKFRYYYRPIWEDVIVNGHHYLPHGYTYDNAEHLLRNRIAKSSTIQTAKGILTAGAAKSIKYAWKKKVKAWKSH